MSFVISVMDYIARQRAFRRTCKSLHRLDDHLLRDIGVQRDQIELLARRVCESEQQGAAVAAHKGRNQIGRYRGLAGHGLAAQH